MASIENINKMDYTEFIRVFGSVIELSPLVAASVWTLKPFSDLTSLHRAFYQFINELSKNGKVGLLRCHPDLAGKMAQNNQLSSESTSEQRAAGLSELSEDEQKTLTYLNERYKQKFGFPFVVCARENKKETILREIRKRLNNDIGEEVECGVEEMCKIAWYRLADLVDGSSAECQPESDSKL